MRGKIVLYIFLFLLSHCTNKSNEIEKFENVIKIISGKDYDNFNIFIIIPEVGCDYCINKAQEYLMQYHNSINTTKRIKFIITKINSLKILKNKLGNEILLNPNVALDMEICSINQDLIPYIQ